jgi:MoaA/NifB/PqqE/SkfB family radical SAM enzyme
MDSAGGREPARQQAPRQGRQVNIGKIRVPGWRGGRAPGMFTIDPDEVTTTTPQTLWIELTSKCPFDCIFCSRRVRFGAGENLDFEIYKRLMGELQSPDFIYLNYSGESIYYPRLREAIELAVATGASTELVTAFSTISQPVLRGIVESGLDRLAISVHTMDPRQYESIYRFGSLDLLERRIDELVELRSQLGVTKPSLGFCFVALDENLDQLLPVAEYALQLGIPEVSIHPILGRHLVPHDFSRELSANRLRDEFKEALRREVAAVRAAHPGFVVNVLNPDIDPDPRVSRTPAYFAPPLPAHARIYSCDQSPFESVHVLASGAVVVCEVHDEVRLGDLRTQSLREIWHGEAYRDFRRKYVAGVVPECRTCVWKLAYEPAEWSSSIVVADGMSPQLLRGWHAHEGSGLVWSKKQALLALGNPESGTSVRIVGILPHGPAGQANSVTVCANRVRIGEIRNETQRFLDFDTTLRLPEPSRNVHVEFSTAHLHRPSLYGPSSDSRNLGAGLQRIALLA